MDGHLDDEKNAQHGAFLGATLQLNPGEKPAENMEFRGTGANISRTDPAPTGGVDRNARPGSTMSRKSNTSTGSHSTMSKTLVTNDICKKLYFSQKVFIILSPLYSKLYVCECQLPLSLTGETFTFSFFVIGLVLVT